MRTTIDLPEDLHALARQLAHDSNRSMSEVVADLIRQGLRPSVAKRDALATTGRRGMPLVTVGHPVTAEHVRSLDDDE